MNGIKMPTITVTATDSAMAMDEVVRQLGSEAYILSTTQQNGLVQIKASIDPLHSAPRHPKTAQTVFEAEMEKQFSVTTAAPAPAPIAASAEILKLVSVEGGSSYPSETRAEPGNQQFKSLRSALTEPRAQMEPMLKVVQPQPALVQRSIEAEISKSIEARLTRLEEKLELISPPAPKAPIIAEAVTKTTTSHGLAQYDLVDLGFDRSLIDTAISSQKSRGLASSNSELIASMSKQLIARDASSTLTADVILVVGPSGGGKTTLSAKFASLINEMMEARIVHFVSLENTSQPKVRLLHHYAELLDVPLTYWPLHQPEAWDAIEPNTVQIVDLACTTDEVIDIWPKIQAHFADYNLQVVMALPTGLSPNRLANELKKSTQLNAQVVITKLDESELSIPEISELLTRSAKVGWLTGKIDLNGNLAKATSEIMEHYLLSYVIESKPDSDDTGQGNNI